MTSASHEMRTDPNACRLARCRVFRGPRARFARPLYPAGTIRSIRLLSSKGRTLRSTPESSPRAGYDGAERKCGSKVHIPVDRLGHLLALHVTPADVGGREAVGRLAADIQEATSDAVKLAHVDQEYTGDAARGVAVEGITL